MLERHTNQPTNLPLTWLNEEASEQLITAYERQATPGAGGGPDGQPQEGPVSYNDAPVQPSPVGDVTMEDAVPGVVQPTPDNGEGPRPQDGMLCNDVMMMNSA